MNERKKNTLHVRESHVTISARPSSFFKKCWSTCELPSAWSDSCKQEPPFVGILRQAFLSASSAKMVLSSSPPGTNIFLFKAPYAASPLNLLTILFAVCFIEHLGKVTVVSSFHGV